MKLLGVFVYLKKEIYLQVQEAESSLWQRIPKAYSNIKVTAKVVKEIILKSER